MSKRYLQNLQEKAAELKRLKAEQAKLEAAFTEAFTFIRAQASEIHEGKDPPHVVAAQALIKALMEKNDD